MKVPYSKNAEPNETANKKCVDLSVYCNLTLTPGGNRNSEKRQGQLQCSLLTAGGNRNTARMLRSQLISLAYMYTCRMAHINELTFEHPTVCERPPSQLLT